MQYDVITIGSATEDVFVECEDANIVSVSTKNRKAEFMRIMSEAASGLRKRLLFAARNRTRVVFILTLIALAGLLPSVKWGFGIKLAAVCLGLVFTVMFDSF